MNRVFVQTKPPTPSDRRSKGSSSASNCLRTNFIVCTEFCRFARIPRRGKETHDPAIIYSPKRKKAMVKHGKFRKCRTIRARRRLPPSQGLLRRTSRLNRQARPHRDFGEDVKKSFRLLSEERLRARSSFAEATADKEVKSSSFAHHFCPKIRSGVWRRRVHCRI